MTFKRIPLIYPILVLSFIINLATGCSSGAGGSNSSVVEEEFPQGKNISNTPTDSSKPAVTADPAGNVYVVWEETLSNPNKEIYLAKSNTSGSTFTKAKSLSRDSMSYCTQSGSSSAEASIMAGDNNSLYLAWIDSWPTIGVTAGVTAIKFFRERDPSCSIITDIYYNPRNVYSPQIASSGSGDIHIAWTEDLDGGQKDIFYRRSANKGETFLPSDSPINISNSPSDSSGPLLGFDGTLNIDMAWVEGSEGGRGVVFKRSTDSGNIFSNPQTVSVTGIDSYCPVLATAGKEKIYVAYKGNNSIYFTRWQSTTSFSNPVSISPYSSSPSCPEMDVSPDGTIYVIWSDAGEIWVTLSPVSGYSFSYPKNISSTSGVSSSPKIAIDGSYVNIVWVEEDIGNGDIYFSGSRDNGLSFTSPKNMSNSAAHSDTPVIASDGKEYIYISWAEGSEGSKEIYFIRDPGARGGPLPVKKSFDRFLDISGDGKSDIVIGGPKANNVGEVYVFYSDFIQPQIDGTDISTSSADYILSEGSAGDQFGYSTAIAGDINRDGYADIIVGAPYADDGQTDIGRVYIYYGGHSSSMDNTADINIRGMDINEHLGFSVSPAGDVNGDGFDDIIFGAPDKYQFGIPYAGVAYIFFGGPSLVIKPGYPNLSSDDADVILRGENGQDKFGSSVSWAGDFNRDGYGDVIVGAPLVEGGGNTRGRAYIYYGGLSMDSSVDVKITGGANFDQLGDSVARAGDIDRDGYGDVIIGAPSAAGGGIYRGKVYVIYGVGSVASDINLESTTARLTILRSATDHAFFGTSLGYAGDVNNDGYSDIVAGSSYYGSDPYFIGRSYAYFGGPYMDNTPEVTFIGNDQTDRFGTTVAGAGDVDGDGYYDILIGAYSVDGDGANRGRAYLYLGGNLMPGDIKYGNTADVTFTGDIDNGWAGYSLYKR